MMLITTDVLIPFMPRAIQNKLKPERLNIKKVEKEAKSKNDLTSEDRPNTDLSHYVLRHHKAPYQDDNEEDAKAKKQTKHIDIMA
ncbi:hypothetical protein HR060_16475 [Catenovulum sp. SM1970]|uniref:hypothetical protein n=1 Tax=Marinifaba aquimaris TaxID=2741323 RepID=UPI001573F4AF|nr:hypothetical protein [Marinifaba aquimaris]NTS78446.1 hypothetical protein [Marinifaba aquimaris]